MSEHDAAIRTVLNCINDPVRPPCHVNDRTLEDQLAPHQAANESEALKRQLQHAAREPEPAAVIQLPDPKPPGPA